MKFILAALTVFVGFLPSLAQAQCQCGRTCGEEVFVGEQLPANAGGIAAWQTWTDWSNVQIRLEKLGGAEAERIETTVVLDDSRIVGDTALIVPSQPWEVGATYRIFLDADSDVVDDIACGRGNARSFSNEFEISPPIETLSAPGAPVISEPTRAEYEWALGGDECATTLDSVLATVEFELPPEAVPFADSIQWQIVVDGEANQYTSSVCEIFPPGASPLDSTSAQIAAACSPWQQNYPTSAAELPGQKSVVVTGRIAGTDVTFTSEASAVDLSCEPLPEPEEPVEEGCSTAGGGGFVLGFLSLLGLFVVRRRRHV